MVRTIAATTLLAALLAGCGDGVMDPPGPDAAPVDQLWLCSVDIDGEERTVFACGESSAAEVEEEWLDRCLEQAGPCAINCEPQRALCERGPGGGPGPDAGP